MDAEFKRFDPERWKGWIKKQEKSKEHGNHRRNKMLDEIKKGVKLKRDKTPGPAP